MSTDRQETSIGDQRAAILKYAEERGYRIVGEYIDEGISGDDTGRRDAFQRMIRDSARGRFELILCWDQDRFGRFDPIEGGFWIKPIRDAGVQLETISQGRIDWSDFSSRLIWTVTQEAKHAYLRDLARNISRGVRASVIDRGVYPGIPPFGYRKESKKLVLGDPADVATIQEIFRLKCTGLGYSNISFILRDRGARAPGRGEWSANQVRYIIKRKTYCGRLVYGKCQQGKYSSIGSTIDIPDVIPPIVSVATWEAANATCRKVTPYARKGRFRGAFSGIVVCGRCGENMYRCTYRGDPGYICGRYAQKRDCGCCRISDVDLLGEVAKQIAAIVGSNIPRLRKAMLKELQDQQPEREAKSLQEQIADIDTKIAKAAERMIDCPDSALPTFRKRLDDLAKRRDSLTLELQSIEHVRPIDVDQQIAALSRFSALLASQPQDLIREVVTACVDRVVVEYEQIHRGKQRRFFAWKSMRVSFRHRSA